MYHLHLITASLEWPSRSFAAHFLFPLREGPGPVVASSVSTFDMNSAIGVAFINTKENSNIQAATSFVLLGTLFNIPSVDLQSLAYIGCPVHLAESSFQRDIGSHTKGACSGGNSACLEY